MLPSAFMTKTSSLPSRLETKAIFVPSGFHEGRLSSASLVVNCRRLVPSAFNTQISLFPAFVEEKMFATLDTASRRLRFPKERDVIITDTVGFIRDLPKDLFAAFKATLEELEDTDLLLHVVDISNPRFEQQIK